MNKLLKISFASSLIFSAFLFAQAQTVSPRGTSLANDRITFPIAELGSCGSQVECKAYCNKAENIDACSSFAEKHNLISKAESEKNKKFAKALKQGRTPGGCDGAENCKAYCETSDKIEECVKFAEENDLLETKEIERAKKFVPLMKSGRTPGGCKSERECKSYCDSDERQEECLEFAERNGFIGKEELEKAKKFIPLMKKGETPGGCKGKEVCEAYCHQPEHQTECLDFAVKVGAMKPEDAEKFKKMNGEGPGGCKSKDACEAFCNSAEHQEECINFAKERGFIKEGGIKDIQEGQAGLQMGVHNFPPEVKQCLEGTLGAETISQIEDGQFTPTSEVGGQMKDCFEKFRPQMRQQMKQQFQADPQTEACMKQAVGEEALNQMKEGQTPPDSGAAAKMRSCFDQQGQREQDKNQQQTQEGNGPSQSMQMMRDCLAKKLDSETVDKMDKRQVDTSSPEIKSALGDCAQQFKGERQGSDAQGNQPSFDKDHPQKNSGRPNQGIPQGGDSSKIKNCLQEKLGEDGMKKMADLSQRNSADMQAVMTDCGYRQRPSINEQGQAGSGGNQKYPAPDTYKPGDNQKNNYNNYQKPDGRQEQYFNQYPPKDSQYQPPPQFNQPPNGSQYQPKSGDYQEPPAGGFQSGGQPPPASGGSAGFLPPPPTGGAGLVQGASTQAGAWQKLLYFLGLK